MDRTVVPSQVLRSIDTLWSTCSADIRGQYDPPYVLTAQGAAAVLTASDPFPTIAQPQPAQSPQQDPPVQTASPPAPAQSHSASGDPPATASYDPTTESATAANPNLAGVISSIAQGLGKAPSPSHSAVASPNYDGTTGSTDGDPDSNSDPGSSPAGQSDPASEIDPGGAIVSLAAGGKAAKTAAEPAPAPQASAQPNSHGIGQSGASSGDPRQTSSGDAQSDPSTNDFGDSPDPDSKPGSGADPSPGSKSVSGLGSASSPSSGPDSSDPNSGSSASDPSSGSDVGGTGLDFGPSGASSGNREGSENAGAGHSAADPAGDGLRGDSGGPSGSQTGLEGGQAGGQAGDQAASGTPQPEIAGQPIAADPSTPGGIIIDGKSVGPGQTANIGGIPISNDPNGVVVAASSTIPIIEPAQASERTPLATIGGQNFVVDPTDPSAVVAGGTQTIRVGSTAVIDNTPISVGPNGIVIATSSTIGVRPASRNTDPSVVFTAGGQAYTTISGKSVVFSGTTLTPGGSATTVNGEVVSLGNKGIVVGSSTIDYSVASNPTAEPGAVITLGSSPFTALESSSRVVIAGQTLSAGGPATTISGKTISLVPSGIVVNGVTQSFSDLPNISSGSSPVTNAPIEVEAPLTIAGKDYTIYQVAGHSGTAVILDANGVPTTISAGGSGATIGGETISLGNNGAYLVSGSSTSGVSFQTVTGTLEQVAVLTDGPGHIHTAIEGLGETSTAVIDGSITLTVGGASTVVDGETLSLGPGGLAVDGTTQAFSTVSSGPDGAIITASGLGPWTSAVTASATFSGVQPANASGAETSRTRMNKGWYLALGGFGLLMVIL